MISPFIAREIEQYKELSNNYSPSFVMKTSTRNAALQKTTNGEYTVCLIFSFRNVSDFFISGNWVHCGISER